MILTFIQCSFSAFSSVSDNLTAALLIYFWSPGPLGGSSSAMKPRPDSVGSHWWYCWLSMVIIGDGIELCCKTISVWLKSRNKISKIGAVFLQKILLLEDKDLWTAVISSPHFNLSLLHMESFWTWQSLCVCMGGAAPVCEHCKAPCFWQIDDPSLSLNPCSNHCGK